MQARVADLQLSGEEMVSPVQDFMRRVAEEMGKQPEDFQKYVSILEENMIDTVESLGFLTEAEMRKDL
jgi:hypothetical protein